MEKIVREAISRNGSLGVDVATIGANQNLFDLGLKSYACVQILLAIEQALDVEFPEDLMRRETFSSVSTIIRNVEAMMTEQTRTSSAMNAD